MKLGELFEMLTLGELKQVAVGGFADYGQVQAQDTKELVQHVNLGLMQLYTRINLKEKELKVHTRVGKEIYPLEAKYAKSSGNPDWFIDDTGDPFTDDILGVQSVWLGTKELPLNDEFTASSVFLPSYKCMQVPWASGSEVLHTMYRAAPAKMTGDLEEEVPLPDVLTEALLSYVEFRVRKSMGGESNTSLAVAARSQFETLLAAVENRGLLNDADNAVCVKPSLGGWV